MPEAAGEYVDIPALLKGILNGYPGNSAIFREYLQNSDDAGASSQVFILDEREYPSELLVEPCLRAGQGAALVAINDGVLEPADWTALQKIHSSSKTDDESRTGKNGLGFRASYHLTENPQILSQRKLLVLDAHQRFREHRGGFSIDTIDEKCNYPHQLAPFASFVDDFTRPFNGTIFRLPLRTQAQADASRIKDTPTPASDIEDLLYDFCEKEAEEVILFLKHITTIEIRHVNMDGESVVVGKVEVEGLSEEQRKMSSGTIYRKITVTDHEGAVKTRTWCHHISSTSRESAQETMTRRMGFDLGLKLQVDKLTPGVELAFPTSGAPVSGRLYTLLPLPISTGFPMHVNAVFALTPDRQSLKNLLEVGGVKSRERLLVEWNKALFDVWIPRAWAELLTDYVEAEREEQTAVTDYWLSWPPQQHGQGLYWSQLPNRVVEETLRRRLPVFPSSTRNNFHSFVTLSNPSVLLATSNPGIPLDVLTDLDIDVVQPPQYLCSIVQSFDGLLKGPVLTPKSLYDLLKKKIPQTAVPPVDINGVRVITDFLASVSSQTPTLAYLDGIRWFLTTDNSHVALKSHANRYLIAASEDECELFSGHPLMLSWETLSRELRSLFVIPRHFGLLHISTLRPEDVVVVLIKKFSTLKGPYIPEPSHHWLVRFWTWMSTWSRLAEFHPKGDPFKKCKDLLILPTAERSARKLSMHTFVFDRAEDLAAVEAWKLLDVRPLHSDCADSPAVLKAMKNFVEFPRTKGYVPLLIKSCKVENRHHLSQDALLALQKSLSKGLPLSEKLNLNDADQRKLADLQVFKLRSRDGDTHVLGSICGQAMYVKVCTGFPIPLQPGDEEAIFVDMTDEATSKFVQLLDNPDDVHSEIDLLRIAFVHWDLQPTEIQDRLVRWLFDNILTVPEDLRDQLRDLPFVTVENSDVRVRPVGLIDPSSSLRTLYLDEPGKIPTGPFGNEYLDTMRMLGFVHSKLDEVILKERLGHLSRLFSSDPHRFKKAKYLVDACNQDWIPKFDSLVSHMRGQPWMPFDNESLLLSPNQCRDTYTGRGEHEDPYYYDLALRILPAHIQITSSPFRAALGWTNIVRSEVLVNQFRLTIEMNPSRKRNERLIALINYLGLLYHDHKVSSTTVEELVSVSNEKCWIPLSTYGDEAVRADFAMLSPEVDLKPPFHVICHFQYPEFLKRMGCHQRPTLDVLTKELNQMEFNSESGKEVAASILILQEIADQYPDFDQRLIRVPGDNGEGLPVHRVYFRDMNFLNPSGSLIDLVSAHKSISRGLAEALRIPFLSSMLLEDSAGEPDDGAEEEEQMSEDFVNRIQGFLREYDVGYAMNEFLANADDARASEFSIMLHTPTTVGERFLSPAFQRLAGVPLLVLHNSATFSEEDFSGLKHVGLGGKRQRQDTHGRHGLGALSFYYFTDVVTVVSGEDVLFLDPSGDNLPPLRRGRKRTALRRKISDFTRQFPDQLKTYDSLFDFSAKTGYYDGTIFFLPLKTTISGTPCTSNDVHDMIKSSYRSLSEKAFFFTNLEQISAKEFTNAGDRLLWSISATRTDKISLENGLARRDLTLEHRSNLNNSPVTEKWLIMTSGPVAIPEEHEQTAVGLKIPAGSSTCIQLAIRTDNANVLDIPPSSLFSTLSLPQSYSMPFHVNARFAISSNRQSIVLIPPGSDSQIDPKTAYNMWILEKLVPPLHLAALHYLVRSDPSNTFYHDRWWLLDTTDEISNLVHRHFLEKLAESDQELFRDLKQHWLPFREAIFSRGEPEQVRRVLCTAKAPKFVLYDHLTKLASTKFAKSVNGQYVKDVLAAEGHSTVLDMYKSKRIDRTDIARILEYIRTEQDVKGLPLIVLSSDILVDIPGRNEAPIYRSAPAEVTSLFSLSRFLAPIYTEGLEKRLANDEHLNIRGFSEQDHITLLREELAGRDLAGKRAWLEKFWKLYRSLPGPPDLKALEECGYPVVSGSSCILSLSKCTPTHVVYFVPRRNSLVRAIVDILQKFDIEIVTLDAHSPLDDYLSPKFSRMLTNVLLCMQTKGVLNWGVLDNNELQQFAEWIRENLVNEIPHWNSADPPCEVTKQYLRQLPIWKAQNHRGEVLHSISSLKIVPNFFDEQRMLPYQKTGVVVCHPSHTLSSFMKFVNGDWPKNMSPKAIMEAVDIPQHIAPEGLEPLRLFNASMLHLPRNELRHAELKVPDRLRNLRDVRDLYDDAEPLFARTLIYTARPSFVHPTFHGLREHLRPLGLRHEVNPTSFQTCAQEISHVLELHEAGTVDRDTLFQMSDYAFEVYQTIIPRLIMIDPAKWSPIDAIPFVRRKAVRRLGATYDVTRYFEDELPLLQSPSRLVRRSLSAVGWSQRGLFEQEPSDEVVAVNKTIGIPNVDEVVEHLKFLAKKVAPENAGDATLLHDLKATYTWLDDHAEQAHEALVRAADEPIFLNVEDPVLNPWTGKWIHAHGMVLHLHYDCGGLKRVERFLSDYPKLLAVSGSVTLKTFQRGPRDEPTQDAGAANDNIRATFDAMRKAGELTDVVLVPTTPAVEGVTETEVDNELDTSQFRAHLSFLSAAIPHVRQSAQGWLVNSTGKIPFYGSAFGAKALLDFAYTGDFKCSVPTANVEDLGKLMNDLLELLPISDEWDMPLLKRLLEHKIIHKYNMIQRLPHLYYIMLDQAEKYRADTLKNALVDFKKENEEFLSVLSR